MSSEFLPSINIERAEYELHQNSDDDLGYLKFLDRARLPLLNNIESPANGLDFGSGPNPVLARRLAQDGFDMQVYDPLFAPNPPQKPKNGFDFIVSTEAIEHFHQPDVEWQQWLDLLSPNGLLVIMTKRWLSVEKFANWHYKNDQTHVSFFNLATFEYLAKRDGFLLETPGADVVLMRRLCAV
ncbi:class I SAM-dependent methyltransferase [Alteromonas sp. ASW11-36]|uniref:Class I SAM-dependent methyltransferase n=1 Tax=Alteromonas arenosi TaxID=3055817 RepID=A0ABT7ST74_9ALTE|nr:class I SAM-dependent methyltransferase [Alteromonas sp. ASW11-36]MDM7859355.1 class I SAM-dependent methyltransferase [Alteromonas sp. ASW11-36]